MLFQLDGGVPPPARPPVRRPAPRPRPLVVFTSIVHTRRCCGTSTCVHVHVLASRSDTRVGRYVALLPSPPLPSASLTTSNSTLSTTSLELRAQYGARVLHLGGNPSRASTTHARTLSHPCGVRWPSPSFQPPPCTLLPSTPTSPREPHAVTLPPGTEAPLTRQARTTGALPEARRTG